MKTVTIIGAGLAGGLLALYLAKRGYTVSVYESRPDWRGGLHDKGRSINLALSCRGLTALAGIGLLDKVTKIMVPMRGRAIHEQSGEIVFQAFGRTQDEYINAIQRSDLTELLLDEIDKNPRITVVFDRTLSDLDVDTQQIRFSSHKAEVITENYQRLIGADGATSAVRAALVKENLLESTRVFEPHGYKELRISPPRSCLWPVEHLHLWPRESFLLLGNPNLDESITGSLFLPHKGRYSFEELDTPLRVSTFIKQAFPDACDAMPEVVSEFLEHPTGHMSTIKTTPWYYRDQCLLIGDAAHGIIPFFGQGMNSAFEDCRVLDGLLQRYNDDWARVMPAFYSARRVNTDAVSQMSMDNYHEIQFGIRDKHFNNKKQLDSLLMARYPDRYISKHVQVMFTNTPYAKAQACGVLQNALLDQIISSSRCLEDIQWEKVDKWMLDYDKKLTDLQNIP